MAIDVGRAVTMGKSLWRETSNDDVAGLAAELSYRFLLALFPFFIFLASLAGYFAKVSGVNDPSDEIIRRIGDTLPSDAASLLETQLSAVLEESRTGLLSFGIILALWAASGGMKATMKAMNRAYDVEEARPFWKKNLLALGLTLFASLFFILAFTLAVAGGAIASAIADQIGAGSWFMAGFHVARFLVALVLLSLVTAFLYWAAPAVDIPFRFVSPGSVMFVVVWLLATIGFSFYVSNFGSYNATYGTLGGVIILLFWFYITGFILLAGAELNALLHRMALQTEAEQPSPSAALAKGTPVSAAAAQRGRAAPEPAGESRREPRRESSGGAKNGRISAALGAAVAAVAAWRASGRRHDDRGSMAARG